MDTDNLHPREFQRMYAAFCGGLMNPYPDEEEVDHRSEYLEHAKSSFDEWLEDFEDDLPHAQDEHVRVLKFVRSYGPVTPREISDHFGFSTYVRAVDLVRYWRYEGEIEVTQEGKYRSSMPPERQ